VGNGHWNDFAGCEIAQATMVIGRFGQDCAKAGAVAATSAASTAMTGMIGATPPEEIGSLRMNLHEMSLLIICISQKPCVGANTAMCRWQERLPRLGGGEFGKSPSHEQPTVFFTLPFAFDESKVQR